MGFEGAKGYYFIKNKRNGISNWIMMNNDAANYKWSAPGDCLVRWDYLSKAGDWQAGDEFFFYQQDTADPNQRLRVVDFGIDDDGFRDMECTPLVEETGSQVLTLTVGRPSFAAMGVENGSTDDAGDYWFFVPGVDTAKLRLLVP